MRRRIFALSVVDKGIASMITIILQMAMITKDDTLVAKDDMDKDATKRTKMVIEFTKKD